MKRNLLILATVLMSAILLTVGMPAPAYAATTHYVAKDGSEDFTSIQAAIDSASSGDTIIVMPGTYNEHLTIDNKTLTLEGWNRETTILEGSGTGLGIDIKDTTGVTTSNLTISNYSSGIRLQNSDNNIITSNNISDNYYIPAFASCGVEIRFSDNNLVTNNIISNNENGIYLNNNSTGNLFENNTISGNKFGVFSYGCEDNTIKSNDIIDNSAHGINFYIYSRYNSVIENSICNNSLNGIFSFGSSITSGNNTIKDNDISDNGRHGIFINYNSSEDIITGNTVSGNAEEGIWLHNNIYYPKVYNNTVESNACGIHLYTVYYGEVYNNNFIDNTDQTDVYLSYTSLFNLDAPTGGNYWSNWNTPDNDGDGFVDVHYTITGYGYDELPWAIPNGWLQNQPPDEITVLIDIKPGSDANSINLGAKGVVPVAVLTTADFDATTLKPDTVVLAGAEPKRWTAEDVDGDGDLDLLFHFRTQELDLTESSTEATLTGQTLDDDDITGTDSVRIVPSKNKK